MHAHSSFSLFCFKVNTNLPPLKRLPKGLRPSEHDTVFSLRDRRGWTRSQQEHSSIKQVLIRILKIWKGNHVFFTARGLSDFLFQLSQLGMVIATAISPPARP